MKLAIISHTQHFADAAGTIYGWGPTVREINFLASEFEEITHVACIHNGVPPASCLPYSSKNIHFIPIAPTGGKSIIEKLNVLTTAPDVIRKVSRILKEVDAVQVRLPTGIGNYLLPYLTIKNNHALIWVKYAGNWKQDKAPLGYKFQRWWLERNFLNCKVTINGAWENQPKHCISFENPCLDELERKQGSIIISKKNYCGPYTASFIGRMETAKGVNRILEALSEFAKQNISTIHFIGDGKEKKHFEHVSSSQTDVRCVFHNSMSREKISEYLAQSHFLILPSDSEGFPKVIAEAANYGAIPIVSDVSSISQYINETNGFVWNPETNFREWLSKLTFLKEDLENKSRKLHEVARAFTFEKYLLKLKSTILNDR